MKRSEDNRISQIKIPDAAVAIAAAAAQQNSTNSGMYLIIFLSNRRPNFDVFWCFLEAGCSIEGLFERILLEIEKPSKTL